jgi:hypothetical protein
MDADLEPDGVCVMAKRPPSKATKTGPKKPDRRSGRPVRLDLSATDHERLERIAAERGLNKAAYARMAVLERMRADEGTSA